MIKILMFLLLAVLFACSDEEIGECGAQPEPFRFKVVDQAGSNLLIGETEPTIFTAM